MSGELNPVVCLHKDIILMITFNLLESEQEITFFAALRFTICDLKTVLKYFLCNTNKPKAALMTLLQALSGSLWFQLL